MRGADDVCAIGLMSGTSLDGVDAAVAIVSGDGARIVALGPCLSRPYDASTRRQIASVLSSAATVAARAAVAELLTRRHAEVVHEILALCAPPFVPTLVGFHGQTVEHRPRDGVTVQLGDAALLAQLVGLDVCSDFRTQDVAAGGNGAPLAPCYHAALLRSRGGGGGGGAVALLNVGGVANFTYLSGDDDAPLEAMVAADTGPGCALIDDFMLRRTGVPLDRDGATAASGTANSDVLEALFALGVGVSAAVASPSSASSSSNWFDAPPPKSLDRNTFAAALDLVDAACQSTADGAATLTEFTALCVARVVPHLPTRPKRWLVCGGGRRNLHLLDRLRGVLNRGRHGGDTDAAAAVRVDTVEKGCDADATIKFRGDFVEAECFAFLAVRSALKLPLSFPRTTGVAVPTSGGHITQCHASARLPLATVMASSPASVPLWGMSLHGFDAVADTAMHGARVFRKSGAGFHAILHPVGNIPQFVGKDSTPNGGVTTLIPPGEAIPADAREIKAAVWDNVLIPTSVLESHAETRDSVILSDEAKRRIAFVEDNALISTESDSLTPSRMAHLLFEWADRGADGFVDREEYNEWYYIRYPTKAEGMEPMDPKHWEASAQQFGIADPSRGFTRDEWVLHYAGDPARHKTLLDHFRAQVRVGTRPQGAVGKVYAFRPGTPGSPDVYVIQSLVEGKMDAHLLSLPTIGWSAENWPENFLDAKRRDKEWQRANGKKEHEWNILAKKVVHLELTDDQFSRYTDYMTTEDVSKLVMMPQCTQRDANSSFSELLHTQWVDSGGALGEQLTVATQFVSHACKYDFATVVGMLHEFVDGDAAGAGTHRFWFNCSTLNQHHAASNVFDGLWFDLFRNAIETIKHTLVVTMPWNSPINLSRAWCVYEVFESARLNAVQTFLMPQRDRHALFFTSEYDEFDMVLGKVNVSSAEGGSTDRERIMREASAYGVPALNGIVCEALQSWRVQTGLRLLEERDPSAEDNETLHLLNIVGMIHSSLGDYEAGETTYRRELAANMKVYGPQHETTLSSHAGLMFSLRAQGKFEEAHPHAELAWRGFQTIMGPENPITLGVANNYASLLWSMGRVAEAEKLFQKVVAGRISALGLTAPPTIHSMHNHAIMLTGLDRLDEALTEERRVVALATECFPPQHHRLQNYKKGLADMLSSLGEYAEALLLYEEAFVALTTVHGSVHPDTLRVARSYIKALDHADRSVDAVSACFDVVGKCRTEFGEHHGHTIKFSRLLSKLLD